MEGLIAVGLSVIGLAAWTQSGENACWCEAQNQWIDQIDEAMGSKHNIITEFTSKSWF